MRGQTHEHFPTSYRFVKCSSLYHNHNTNKTQKIRVIQHCDLGVNEQELPTLFAVIRYLYAEFARGESFRCFELRPWWWANRLLCLCLLQTSSTTKTTTMTTPAKLYGKDLSEYDEIDVDELLQKLSPEEINILAKEVDPDVSWLVRLG